MGQRHSEARKLPSGVLFLPYDFNKIPLQTIFHKHLQRITIRPTPTSSR